MVVYIKEKSFLARIAARRLGAAGVAMVIGTTIHLWGASREEFLRSPAWMRHEVAHVYQYQRLGVLRFLGLYLWETARCGYRENRFEREARNFERDENILNGVVFR